MRILLAVILGWSLTTTTAEARPSFLEGAKTTVNSVWKGLNRCGLVKKDAYVFLPQPQTPADYAIFNRRGRLLAYFLETYGWGPTYVFKNPNGGQVHRTSVTKDHIEFSTPYAGVVAHANRFYTVGGPRYRFYCRSRPVTPAFFEACVKRYWVDVVVGQLCRWNR